MKKTFLLLLTLYLSFSPARAQCGIWQWSVDVPNTAAHPKYAHPEAYLWIPNNCHEVKALVVSQHNMEEISILEDAGFRAQLEETGVAELWICPRFNLPFDFTDGAWEALDETLSRLADLSGYGELASVPLIGLGHSAAASNPYYMAASRPERILACISTSGQWPYHRDEIFCPDVWGDRTVDFIPCLETMGEYESAENWARRGLKEKREHPLTPLSMLACPGEGHFASSPEKARYIALFIRKALQYGHVDPTREGWLLERWHENSGPSCNPAPVGSYAGDPEEAFWFFDREMVEATLAYQSRFRGKARQLVGVLQNGVPVPQKSTHMQLHPDFIPSEDGTTLVLKPFFYDEVSSGSPRHRAWSHQEPGTTIGHGNGTPYLEIIAAPAYVSSDTTLTLQWNRMAAWEEKEVFIDFCIKHPGDSAYRPAVQQARITIPVRLTEGTEQHIRFKPIRNISQKTRSLILRASSDSGLPISFYAECGPVRIEGNRLIVEEMPPKSRYPVKVSVVAFQYGKAGNDPVQTAEPVRQVFYITE